MADAVKYDQDKIKKRQAIKDQAVLIPGGATQAPIKDAGKAPSEVLEVNEMEAEAEAEASALDNTEIKLIPAKL